uniref:Uncharacterized protein n=1 Tax=Anguilla anguilla TaxID=7936 RepID=A0A0E9UMK6_ANGAN
MQPSKGLINNKNINRNA